MLSMNLSGAYNLPNSSEKPITASTPCREGEAGEPKSWLDFKDQSELDIGTVTRADFEAALKRTKPSVDQTQLKEY